MSFTTMHFSDSLPPLLITYNNFKFSIIIFFFKSEAACGEVASCITCYMRYHIALNYLIALLDDLLKELNWEYLKPNSVPTITKDFAYSIQRSLLLFYKERDGYSISTMDVKKHVTIMLLEPVNM